MSAPDKSTIARISVFKYVVFNEFAYPPERTGGGAGGRGG